MGHLGKGFVGRFCRSGDGFVGGAPSPRSVIYRSTIGPGASLPRPEEVPLRDNAESTLQVLALVKRSMRVIVAAGKAKPYQVRQVLQAIDKLGK